MTLIVIDQFRTTADSYATVTETDGTVRVEEHFPKIFKLTGPVVFGFGELESFYTLAFCGDAHSFYAFYQAFQPLLLKQGRMTASTLLELAEGIEGNRCMVIVPFENAVLTTTFGGGLPVEQHYHEGSVFAFGSAYLPDPFLPVETRAWFSIFQDAVTTDRLPGNDLHFLAHNREVLPAEATRDTLLPSPRRLTLFQRLGRARRTPKNDD
jgi:hypothetical protein